MVDDCIACLYGVERNLAVSDMTKSETIQDARALLRARGYHVTVFSSRRKMPAALRGLPDLYLMKKGTSYWVEVKLRHANYMRDQMSEVQWQWFHDRKDDFGMDLRYAIVTNAEELIEWATVNSYAEKVYIPIYYQERYEKWRQEYNADLD